MRVGAYHSLTARRDGFPADALEIVARTDAGLVMAVRHRQLPLAAVQFHPESILSMGVSASGEIGRTIIENVVRTMARREAATKVPTGEVVK